jgi:hypothetical protein
MTTRRVEMERFSVVSSKPFQEVLASLKSAVGHPDMVEFARAPKSARTLADLENVVRKGLGKAEFILAPYRNAEALAIAQDLDAKIECLIRPSALCVTASR